MNKLDRKEVGQKLRDLRTSKKYSLRHVGEKLQIDHSYLGKIEKGLMPSMDVLEKLADFYQKDLSYFLVGQEDIDKFSDSEQQLVFGNDLSLDFAKDKFNLIFDGRPMTDEEIEFLLSQVRDFRQKKTSS
ncbi:helix-turn-helix domain-containing protein [Sutcliffiella horikoshii]|uniref:helix-turn-helix domain-containing protein n=1 Tax=Sutcliffiella horikoshii TaxID=79883 RepID=UPI002040BE44|nr:helix-turn-helix transcriptional regulator [Sutcliffiella horikoshii]MCM3619202.1 helix-turn-helix domain-containing protein [Sutcliffiella horikoshii]